MKRSRNGRTVVRRPVFFSVANSELAGRRVALKNGKTAETVWSKGSLDTGAFAPVITAARQFTVDQTARDP